MIDSTFKDLYAYLFPASKTPADPAKEAFDAATSNDGKLKAIQKGIQRLKENVGGNRTLAVSMAILEKAFVDSVEGNKLLRILKELILMMDQVTAANLAAAKKKKNDTIMKKEDIDKEVERFFINILAGRLR